MTSRWLNFKLELQLSRALAELGFPLETGHKLSGSLDGKANKKVVASRKHRRKNKQKAAQSELVSTSSEITEELNSVKGLADIKVEVLQNKELYGIDVDATSQSKSIEDFCVHSPPSVAMPHTGKAKRNRKGGLSLFLSGALDDTPKHVPPPQTPKVEGPAWGGVKFTNGHASSLRYPSIKLKDKSESL